MSIESKSFVATANDIEQLTSGILNADAVGSTGRLTYLKALVGTTQAELGSMPRKRSSGNTQKISEEERAEHLKAFEAVAQRFADAAMKAAKATLPGAGSESLRSATGFARSAASTLRSYIRAFNDVRALAPRSVTKRALAVPRTRRMLTAPILRRRLTRLESEVSSLARNLFAINREMAVEVLQPFVAELMKTVGLTAKPTKNAQIAVEQHRPWQTKTGVYVPIGVQ